MKRAGELLSAFFDEKLLKKAKGYHDLFSTWKSLAGDQIGAHSRIMELERSILIIEADHPGWIQILQMKQRFLLNAVRLRFPDLSINGISFRLSRDPQSQNEEQSKIEPKEEQKTVETTDDRGASQSFYEAISDSEFRETLMRLEKSISRRA